MSKTRTLAEQIESAQEEIRQRENRLKGLLQKKKAQDRKERVHRLCERGAFLESILPDAISLTFEQFKIYLNKTLLTEYANRILRGLSAENAASGIAVADGGNVATEPGKAAQTSTAPVTAGVSLAKRQAR